MNIARCTLLLLSLAIPVAADTATQKAFERLKALDGAWEGQITTNPKAPEIDGKTMNVTLRVTSMGNALMHEMTGAGRPDDPITILYLEDEKLALTHFCDAGNRPRMLGTVAADGTRVEFEFSGMSGGDRFGHMHRAVFTFVDESRHTEDWYYMMPGGGIMHAHVELKRTAKDHKPAAHVYTPAGTDPHRH